MTDLAVRVTDCTAERLQLDQDRARYRQDCSALLGRGLCHDLNNLLAVILAHASGLRLSLAPEPPPPAAGAIGGIVDAAQQAAALTRRAAEARLPEHTVVDTGALVADCAAVLAHQSDCTVEWHAPPEALHISGNPALLAEAILAVGRKLAGIPSAIPDSKGAALVMEARQGVSVYDGVPPTIVISIAVLPEGAAVPEGAANAEGLDFVRSVARHHRGEFEVRRTAGGLSGEFSFPGLSAAEAGAQNAALPRVKASPAPAAPGNERIRILVADDEENFRLFISWVLNERGYEVVAARDGQEALERFQEDPTFKLVILDAYMPRMGGLDAYLRMQMVRADLPVLFASGFARGASVDALIAGCPGPASVILKPFSTEDLVEAVNRALAAR